MATSDRPEAMAAYALRIADCPDAHASSVRWMIRCGVIPSCSAARGATWDWNAKRSGSAAPRNSESMSEAVSFGMAWKSAAPASWQSSGHVAARTPNFVVAPPTTATSRFSVMPGSPGSTSATRSPASEVDTCPPWS